MRTARKFFFSNEPTLSKPVEDYTGPKDSLRPDVWILQRDMFGSFFFEKANDFPLPEKIYGSVKDKAAKIWKRYIAGGKTMGVLVHGLKGAGKTLTAKEVARIAIENNCPVVLINKPYHGSALGGILSKILTPCVVILDEFEKVYNDKEDQESLLQILDGFYTAGNKLFIFSSNADPNSENKKIIDPLVGRPGRILYSLKFDSLDPKICEEYAREELKDQKHLVIIQSMNLFLEYVSFDILQTVVKELNTFPEDPIEAIKDLNLPFVTDKKKKKTKGEFFTSRVVYRGVPVTAWDYKNRILGESDTYVTVCMANIWERSLNDPRLAEALKDVFSEEEEKLLVRGYEKYQKSSMGADGQRVSIWKDFAQFFARAYAWVTDIEKDQTEQRRFYSLKEKLEELEIYEDNEDFKFLDYRNGTFVFTNEDNSVVVELRPDEELDNEEMAFKIIRRVLGQ